MKIAYVFSHKDLNGVTASGTAQIRVLLSRGHQMHVVHRPGAWISEQDFDGDIHFHATEMGGKFLDRVALERTATALKNAGVTVAYSHGTQANRVSAHWRRQGHFGTVAKAAARKWHPHWFWQHAVIAPSQYTADWYHRLFLVGRRKMHVVPNFVREQDIVPATQATREAARAELGLEANDFAVCLIGSVDERKNQGAVLPILEGLRDRGINAKAQLIGRYKKDGYPQDIMSQAERANLSGSLTLVGHRNDARALLPGFDALICTSKDEQGPVVVIEALAAGVPAVSTPVGMVPTLLTSGVCGEILDLNDPSKAIDFLAELALRPETAEQHAAEGKRVFKSTLDEDVIARKLEAVFETVDPTGA